MGISKKYPNVKIEFIECTKTSNIENLLFDGEEDLAVFNYSGKDNALNYEEIVLPDILLKTRSVYCTARMVSAGNGIVFISGTHVKYIKFNEDPILFSIDNDITKVKLSVVYRKGAYLPQYLRDYIEMIKECLNK